MTTLYVVGDALLDRDVVGSATRLCPDAPVPVVTEDRTVVRPGGAGLAAVLAASGPAEVHLVAPLGRDDAGTELRRALAAADVQLHEWTDLGGTTEKIRMRADFQTLLRWDRVHASRPGPLPASATGLVGADAVLVADYGRGAAARPAVRALLTEAISAGVPVVWDPHPSGTPPVPGTTLVTPNRDEAVRLSDAILEPDVSDEPGGELHRLTCRAGRLRAGWRVGAVAVTLGPRGALVVTGDGVPLMVPLSGPESRNADTCGAGDAFAGAAALALATGSVVSEAVEHAVAAAAEFVAAGGAAGLADAHRPPGPSTGAASTGQERAAPRSGGALVATGGCFDVLHAGHVATLEHARRLGERLVVLLNSDASVRRLKGEQRPLQHERDRVRVLRSLACVDDVVVFDEDTPATALRRLRPDIFVKGGDYATADVAETAGMADWGGAVVAVPFLSGRSTTGILRRATRSGGIDVD